MNAAAQRRLTPFLAGIAVLLGVVFLALLGGVGRKPHWSRQPPAATLPPLGNRANNLPPSLPLDQFAVVWQKPLFNPDRKPSAQVADGGTSLGDLELTGILLTPTLRMALLHDKNGDKQLRLREGQSLPDGSLTLVEVKPRSAVFDASSGRTELKLPAGAPMQQAAGAPPADNDAGGGVSIGPRDSGRGRFGQGGNPNAQQAPGSPFLERLRQSIQRRRAAAAQNQASH